MIVFVALYTYNNFYFFPYNMKGMTPFGLRLNMKVHSS